VLGLGTGTKGMQIGWHGIRDPESPAVRLEELVPLLRRIWKLHEGPVRHEGRFYSMNLSATADVLPPVREGIPIYTAGVNRRMIETAGRVSDGLVCHPTFSSRYVHEVVRPAVAAGADRTGRDPAAVEIVGMLLCSVHEDERIRRAFADGDREAMIAAVSDEMLDAIGVAGTPDQVRDGIARREADFDHLSLYSPSFTLSLERVQQNTLELIRVGAAA
jgi:alkanesulfonate monooxygenase SsuD/methylene tetrahydromethanopterin reductase-like flavin-dependent oxidoreductase (luciferase family)